MYMPTSFILTQYQIHTIRSIGRPSDNRKLLAGINIAKNCFFESKKVLHKTEIKMHGQSTYMLEFNIVRLPWCKELSSLKRGTKVM